MIVGGLTVVFLVFLNPGLESCNLFDRPGQLRILGGQPGVLFCLLGLKFGQLLGIAVGDGAVLLRNQGDIEGRLADGCR